MRRSPYALALLALLACSPRAASPQPPQEEPLAARPAPTSPGFRLPRDVRPLAYRVTLSFDPAASDLKGEGSVELERDGAGDTLYLHAHDLEVTEAQLAGVPLVVTRVDPEMIALRPRDRGARLPAGKATLEMRWRGRLRTEDTLGAFRQQTEGQWYAYTQFEATGARRAIPCFDEPGFKVPWQLTLKVPRGLVALANTPAEAQQDEGDAQVVRFAATPPLPSYLLAFAVGAFDLVPAGQSRGGAPIRIAVPRGHAAEAAYPVEVTAPILHHLEDYFDLPYPYAKLDLVPIPDTVGFGAMENPGLITYVESLLLVRPEELSVWDKRSYASIAAHELAHQWFGNLVTMAWWDDLWLNEAFASWIEDRIVERWQPTWGLDLDTVATRDYSMMGDSSAAGRKIREPVHDPDGIEDAFDGITYGKGASVIHMIERWIGPDLFQRGLRLYVRRHAHGSATYADLTAALAEAAGRPVSDVLDGFVDTTGVPLVSFDLRCEAGKAPRLDLRQERYLPAGSTLERKRAWKVPLVVRWRAGAQQGRAQTLLTAETGALELADARACPDLIVPNAEGAGYYRWRLDGKSFERLLAPRVLRALPATERYDVSAAVSALVGAGELPFRRSIELATTLAQDPARQIRRRGLAAGAGWSEELPPDLLPIYRAWVGRTYGADARAAGFTPGPRETDEERMLRSTLLARMVRDADDPAFQKEALALAWRWLGERKTLAPEMIDVVLGLAAWTGDANLYERLLADARAAADKQDRDRLLGALAGFRDPTLVKRSLDLVMDGGFEILDSVALLWGATGTRTGRRLAFAYVRANYDKLAAKLPEEWRASLVGIGADCTPEALAETEAFFGPRTPKERGGERAYKNTVEGMRLCVARRAADLASFGEFLRAQAGKSARAK